MTKEELRNIDTLRDLTSDTKLLEALIYWLPTDELNEFIEDYIKDYDLEYQFLEEED